MKSWEIKASSIDCKYWYRSIYGGRYCKHPSVKRGINCKELICPISIKSNIDIIKDLDEQIKQLAE